MFGAADFDEIGIAREVACAHFRAGLKSSGAGDQRGRRKVIFPSGSADMHSLNAVHVAVDCTDRRGKADFDFSVRSDAAPLFQLAHAAARDVNCNTTFEIAPIADFGVLLENLPANSGVFHPVHRGVRVPDKRPGEQRVHPRERHALEVGGKVLFRVGWNLQTRE